MLAHPLTTKHIITVASLTRGDIMQLLRSADNYQKVVKENSGCDDLKGQVMTSIFYEPSTRTSCSFKSAMMRLGGNVIDLDVDNSSMKKGESLVDTIRTVSTYSDCIVMRHPDKNSVARAATMSKVPVINAGDGIGEHPTQALLDVFTIYKELGGFSVFDYPLKIGLVGDLKHSRTIHSLVTCLTKLSNKLTFYLIAPDMLQLPQEYLTQSAQWAECKDIEDCIGLLDVLYVTRIQQERFDDLNEYDALKNALIIDPELMRMAKQKMIVMHPLPRNEELSYNVDHDSRAAYFRQMEYGLYMRMAILSRMMKKLRFRS